jgi:hypothetical protein
MWHRNLLAEASEALRSETKGPFVGVDDDVSSLTR